ncbi:MAG: hypothetical protein B6U68_01915 [Candidatus Aenigmarchaeota archaeon ex4484_14]|nr:MAG: hypothetical protein B6U68_01915 [Candidatus Aenigmarchaeota archaeon ex4484_14]
MNEVSTSDGSCVVRFETCLYEPRHIIIAAQAFTDDYWVYLDGNPNSAIQVVLKPKKVSVTDLKKIGYEFYNYVLLTSKNQR